MRVAAAEAYRIWAPDYDATPNPLLALEERALSATARELATGLALDVGCGTGRWARLLPGARYAGIDLCAAMIRRGDCAAGDARALPIADASAQLTLCSFVLGYIEGIEGAFAELARVTRRGGFVMASDLDPDAGWSRAFRRGGAAYEIEHWAHPAERIGAAAWRAGLVIEREQRAAFGEAERPVFRAARREDLFERTAGIPAIWARVWRRP